MQESEPTSTSTLSSSPLPVVPSGDLEALKNGLMSEIEAKLSKKEGDLWKRGQVEIKRLHQEQLQAKEYIGQLQDRQSTLLEENKEIRGALLEVTSRFELVVKEMRQVLRALPQQQRPPNSSGTMQPSPSPSAASTSASEALHDEPSPDSIYEPTAWSAEKAVTTAVAAQKQQTPMAKGKQSVAADLQTEVEKEGTFRTPPRNDGTAAQDTSFDAGSMASPPVLSLAKSLPQTGSTTSPHSSPIACKLQLAECLTGGQASNNPSSSASLAPSPSPPASWQSDSACTTNPASGPTPSSSAKQFDFINVELVKESGFVTLGIEVNQVDGVSLCVESIDERGLVGRHNARLDANNPSRVQVGDRVIEVNNVRQDPNLMLQECKVRSRLNFTIARNLRKASSDVEDAGQEEDVTPTASRMRPEATVFVPASHVAQEVQPAPLPCVLPAVAVVPPGFESYDTAGLLTLPTGPALGTQFASMLEAAASVGIHGHPTLPPPPLGMPLCVGSSGYEGEEEVKRALFP